MPSPDFLVINVTPEGVFLDRFTRDGETAGDTWHPTVAEAKEQAVHEYGTEVTPWFEIPSELESPADILAFVLSR
jgi:hypothetical protein